MHNFILKNNIVRWFIQSALVFALILSYGYFLNGSIANAVEKEKIESGMAGALSRVSDLELERGALTLLITKDRAKELGFSDAAGRTFISLVSPRSVSLGDAR